MHVQHQAITTRLTDRYGFPSEHVVVQDRRADHPRSPLGLEVVWTERARERVTEIEAFVARDHPEAAVRLVDKLIARGDALGRYPDRGRKLQEIQGSGLRELIVDSYRIVYRRVPSTIEVLTVLEGHRLLRRDELPEDV